MISSEKPFKADRLVLVAERALEASRLKREVTELRTRAGRSNKIIGKSTVINQLRQVVERVGPANSRVLITGAPGAGKELTARGIHDASARANVLSSPSTRQRSRQKRWKRNCWDRSQGGMQP